MPALNGQFFLEDYVAELIRRGFDGFSQAELKTIVNRGYFHIARKYPHWWKQTTDTFTISPPNYSVVLGTELPNFHHVERVYVTGPESSRRKLAPMDEEIFQNNYLVQDLTTAQNRGVPSQYYIYEGKLWVLPAPQGDTTFEAHYTRRPAMMVQNSDLPITDVYLDEAIVHASLIRAHKRAMEPGLASLAEADLQEFMDDMLDDDEMLMAEDQERMRPDNTWL